MSNDQDYIVDITGLTDNTEEDNPGGERTISTRKWIGIRFDCCGVYARIYRNVTGTAYSGNCPRCQRRVEVGIGPGGTRQRLFRAI